MLTLFDHYYVFILVLVLPVVGYFNYRALLRRSKAGNPIERSKIYLSTVATQWLLLALLTIIWLLQDRSWEWLGFSLNWDWRFNLGLLFTVAVLAYLIHQMLTVAAWDDEKTDKNLCQLGDVQLLIPHQRKELLPFYGVSLTAGIVEETLWRGYLIWYLSFFMPLWAAAVLSAGFFALAHSYQGAANVPKVLLIGLVLTGLYLFTGSIWLPIVLHAALDALQGKMVYQLLSKRGTQEI